MRTDSDLIDICQQIHEYCQERQYDLAINILKSYERKIDDLENEVRNLEGDYYDYHKMFNGE